ncbi:hypothetical protein ACHAWF_012341 [Thalassiosira exigua]
MLTIVSFLLGLPLASWFAARGLMSRRSFERYQKELKGKVIKGASSNPRASISMCDLRNDEWPKLKPRTTNSPLFVVEDGVSELPEMAEGRKPELPRKPRSVNEGLDQLNLHMKTKHKGRDDSLDCMVKSFISSFNKGTAQNNDLPSLDMPKSKIPLEAQLDIDSQCLDVEEIKVLTKMFRRLSQSSNDGETKGGADSSKGTQGELLQTGLSNDTIPKLKASSAKKPGKDKRRDKIAYDMNKYTYTPRRQKDARPSLELESKDKAELNTRSENYAGPNDSGPDFQRISSTTTIKASNASVAQDGKYVPKRNAEVKLTKPIPRRQASEFEDSFKTAQFESSMTSFAEEDGFDDNTPPPPKRKQHASPLKSLQKQNKLGVAFPLKLSRSDTVSTLSPESPFVGNFLSSMKQQEAFDETPAARSDTVSTLTVPGDDDDKEARDEGPGIPDHGLALPRLGRIQSHVSLSTMVAVAPEDLVEADSIDSECSSHRDGAKSKLTMPPLPSQYGRSETNGTDCNMANENDESSRFEGPQDEGRKTTAGTKDSPPQRRTGGDVGSPLSNLSPSFTAGLNDLDGPPLKEGCGDVLQEGMDHLSMAMLVNVYAKLRELSTLGHASVKLAEIDVNSHQSLARRKEMIRRGLLPEQDSDEPRYLDQTKTAGAVVRAVLEEYEMFQASNELPSGFGSYAAETYDASLLLEFKTWVEESQVRQLDRVTEEVIRNLRKECAARRQPTFRGQSPSNDSLSAMERAPAPPGSVARRRRSLAEHSGSFRGAMWLKQERQLIADHFIGIGGSAVPASSSRTTFNGDFTNSMISRTLEKSHEYFEEGSSLRNLLESGLEVVWFSDRHPDDIIYCICVNRETATVTVVFRGQESLLDLFKGSAFSTYANPLVNEDYEGNSEFISLRSSVSDEMMRVRRDTKKSTMSEIRTKVVKIGKELLGGESFHLSVTGHSLGGGLATIAGYYLASDASLNLASAVRVFTFASARVGCKAFQQGFKHLEQTGRLQHARFSTSNEPVSTLPFWNTYHHVGMQICLHKANNAGRQRTRRSLDVTYCAEGNRILEALCLAWNSLSAFKSSRISEYQHLMHFAREYRLALGDGVLRFDKKRNHLKSLNDYYMMKCRLTDFMGLTKTREATPSFLVFFLVSCLITFEIALLFKFVATWL